MLLKEVEDYLLEHDVEDHELCEEQVQENGFLLEKMVIHIPKYNIKIREGICERWDTESEEYATDYTCYMIFDMLTDKCLYKESGSGIATTLYNFLYCNNQQNITEDGLLELECELYFI